MKNTIISITLLTINLVAKSLNINEQESLADVKVSV